MSHAVVTGPIDGRIPISHDDFPDGFINVTPHTLEFDTLELALAVADAIEAEHVARGDHPIQQECAFLNDPEAHPNGVDPDRIEAHQAAHAALNESV